MDEGISWFVSKNKLVNLSTPPSCHEGKAKQIIFAEMFFSESAKSYLSTSCDIYLVFTATSEAYKTINHFNYSKQIHLYYTSVKIQYKISPLG